MATTRKNMKKNYISCLVAAAGKSRRMGPDKNKILMGLGDKCVLERTLRAVKESGLVSCCIIILKKEDMEFVRENTLKKIFDPEDRVILVEGGDERMDSIREGLKALPEETDIVMIQDGARPFLNRGLIERGLERMEHGGIDGAIAAIPITDTVKFSEDGGLIDGHPDRSKLFRAQTPQIFKKDAILKGYEKAYGEKYFPTDDAAVVSNAGGKVAIYAGEEYNIKITKPFDLLLARQIVKAGGFDEY